MFLPLAAALFASASASAAVDLHLMTVNTWGLPFPAGPPRRERRLSRLGGLAEGADIVGFQEVYGRSAGMLAPGALALVVDGELDTGLAFASRYPVRDAAFRVFGPERAFDPLTRKGQMRATVAVAGGLTAIVVHLQAGFGRRHAERRHEQVDELLASLAEVEGPVVLMGDFNLAAGARDRETAAALEAAGMRDATAGVGPTHRLFHERFDRIYVRDGSDTCLTPLDARVVDTAALGLGAPSDHRPVEAWVRLDACAADPALSSPPPGR